MDDDLEAYGEMLVFLKEAGHDRYFKTALGLLKAHTKLLDENIKLMGAADGH